MYIIFALKHRLLVLVRTCTNNLFFEQKQDKYHIFSTENFHFTPVKLQYSALT